ncbi:MAG: CopG family transcriptional regulator [Treponema sp. GWB1_62_6]|nr:MAG: CopG family transcriptional regulator [Treponema sp. GWC1_61_84]OHE66724.1 MAG: CopG family transcriptional regulator [Treponema sp. GWB1_62_6]OHE76559.1 MAG: CopG family transcriptional regulator [Treponema sp. RIFOXYC1_FULL_61_9]HCM27595.1 CopG family transcriptional regulator [Treponema sp.]
MEKRLGVVAILIEGRASIPRVNQILSAHGDIIQGRLGMPFRDKGVQVISLIVEGTTDQIGALSGPLGRLEGVQVKSILTGYREDIHDGDHNELESGDLP